MYQYNSKYHYNKKVRDRTFENTFENIALQFGRKRQILINFYTNAASISSRINNMYTFKI